MIKVDARGVSCPQPVLMTKKALEENKDGIVVLVDNTTACNNVQRFMKNAGYNVSVKEDNEEFTIEAKK
ncbi:sulfurtransferase TusA family protein [Clostridium senegalense]|uniref:sulfurtransferase TusA family protein n=1 Tax=Clostridium senegalense TaxID=1465809 RepID=UPI001C1285C3|nr:sulfurtransferase TusA family protein [Clostridium senegalense]MBU5228380.1 sulfurtransferase TusA family protein [Clostridium senegalense]